MREWARGLVAGFSHDTATLLLAMMPISELRGAIPYAITVADMTWQKAYALGVIGNFIPVIPLIYLLGPTSKFLRRWRVWDRFFEWLFARTRKKGKLIERFELIGLVLFVAIPLPVTGAWTGCAAAFIFGVSKPKAVLAVLLGILISGAIVTLATTGVIGVFAPH